MFRWWPRKLDEAESRAVVAEEEARRARERAENTRRELDAYMRTSAMLNKLVPINEEGGE